MLFLIVLAFTLLACDLSASLSQGNGPGASPTSTPTEVNLPIQTTETLPPQTANFTLEIETYGEVSSGGVTITDGPFKISIPLEMGPTGLVGHATGIQKETSSGGCVGERTTEEILDVTATGQDPLTFNITWTATVLSELGNCFGIPPTGVVVGQPIELPAQDGASKTIEYPLKRRRLLRDLHSAHPDEAFWFCPTGVFHEDIHRDGDDWFVWQYVGWGNHANHDEYLYLYPSSRGRCVQD